MRTAILFFFLVALAGCGRSGSSTVHCYPSKANGWDFECEITGRGEPKHNGQFSPHLIEKMSDQGNNLNRTFAGERWWALVTVEIPGTSGKVQSGREYKMYGTVASIDGRRVRFTDCVLEPAPKE